MNWISKIWKDPVWSQVISWGIIGLIGLLGLLLKPYITYLSCIPSWIYIVIISIVVIIIIVMIVKKSRKFKYDENTKKNDKEVFDEITKEMLPSDSIIEFVRTQQFGSSFRAERLNLLDEFEYRRNDPHLNFFNPKLETKKKELITSIMNFKNELLRVTILNEHGVQLMLPNIHSDPYKSREVCAELDRLANTICENYDELVRFGKKEGL